MKRNESIWLYLNLVAFVFGESIYKNLEYNYANVSDSQALWENYKKSSGKVYKNFKEDKIR